MDNSDFGRAQPPKPGSGSAGTVRRREWAPYLFIAPFFLAFAAFQLLPIAFSLGISFTEWDGMSEMKFVGFENFVALFSDARFWNALRVTFIITLVCTGAAVAGSLPLAVLIDRVPDRLASLLRVAFFLPAVTSVVVIAYIWKQLYSADYGYINMLLGQLGLPAQQWLSDPTLALPSLIVMLIWAGLGWDALIFAAGLRTIPAELYEAAKVDGAGAWAQFRHITLPLLRPILVFVLVTSVIFLWGIFAQVQLLTGGGPLRQTQTIALYLYEAGFRYHEFGYASAIAVVLSVLMFASSYLSMRFVRSNVEY